MFETLRSVFFSALNKRLQICDIRDVPIDPNIYIQSYVTSLKR